MSKAARYFVSAIVIIVLTLGSMAMAPAARSDASLHLKSGSFIPAQGPSSAASQKYYVVQFEGPVEQEWKDALTAEGAEILEYIPDFAFKVRMNPGIARQVEGFSSVRGVIPFQPYFKLGKDVKQDGETNVYIVRIERGANFGQVRSLVARTGAQVLGAEDDLLVIAATGSAVNAITAIDDVASINNFHLNKTLSNSNAPATNDTSADIVGGLIANSRGYDGSTQIAAVSDTGLGGGTTTTAHPDIPGSRVVAVFNWPGAPGGCFQTVTNDGAIDVDSGHGTHTASSVLSAGDPGGIGRGIAPAAQLVFQATENWATITALCQVVGGYPPNGYFLTGLPSNLGTMYQQAYTAGARIHSNSWGAAVAGDYTVNSANTDAFIWNNRDMVITFSAGNSGIDANANGVIDNDSIGAPATSKNVITIGASENQRPDNFPCDTSLTYTSHDAYQTGQTCNSMGGTQSSFLGTYGQRWGADFPANPIASDLSAGNSQQMAAFSSRGPTDDTRIKPDVVAPGTWILSGASSMYQEGYGDPVNPQNGVHQWDGWGMPYNEEYKYMGGTSMSNPIAAGGATVIKDYYNKAHSINATAALVKATMINSAVDLMDENNDGANDNDFPIPNVHEGWGRINLDAATDGTIQFVDEATGISTGGSQVFNVTSTGGPLKISLVWTDFASTDTAAINLVNDLDLTVSGPSGTFRGNVFSGGWSATGGSADRRNNVENVYIQNATAGAYTVTINGFNVPQGPQKFALVVDGGTIGTTPSTGTLQGTVTNVGTGAPISGATVTITGGASTTTNGSGFYQFTNVAAGTYSVTASATGFNPNTANNVAVTAGNTTTQNFALTATGGGSGTLQGTVTNAATGAVIKSATVTIAGGASTTTNKFGFYQFTNVAAGTYSVTASKAGFNPSTANNVTVNAGSTTVQNFALTTGGSGTGTLQGTVTDAGTGNPISGAVVDVAGVGSTNTDGSGAYQFANVNPGTYSVTASKSGYGSSTVNGVGVTAGNTTTQNFALTAAGILEGTVTDATTGAPISGATVSIPGANTTTDGSGFYQINDVAPGTYSVTASASGYNPSTANGVVVTSGNTTTQNFALNAAPPPTTAHVGDLDGSRQTINNKNWQATVTVTVHDASHAPVANATVNGTWSTGGSGSCVTNASGVCSITSANIATRNASTTFSVTNVTAGGFTYQSSSNHDPDGDSNGTAITILRP